MNLILSTRIWINRNPYSKRLRYPTSCRPELKKYGTCWGPYTYIRYREFIYDLFTMYSSVVLESRSSCHPITKKRRSFSIIAIRSSGNWFFRYIHSNLGSIREEFELPGVTPFRVLYRQLMKDFRRKIIAYRRSGLVMISFSWLRKVNRRPMSRRRISNGKRKNYQKLPDSLILLNIFPTR